MRRDYLGAKKSDFEPDFSLWTGRSPQKSPKQRTKKKQKPKNIVIQLNSSSVSSFSGWDDHAKDPDIPNIASNMPAVNNFLSANNLVAQGAAKQLEAIIENGIDNAEQCLASGAVQAPDGWRFWLTRSAEHISAVRFSGRQLRLVHGLHIVDAHLAFRAYSESSGPVTLRLQAEASDSACPFGKTESYSLSSRPRTASSVMWSPPDWISAGEEYRTPDLSPLLNELVQRDGWGEDSAVVIFVETVPTPGPHHPRVSVSWEAFHGQQSARLLVNYQNVGPAPIWQPSILIDDLPSFDVPPETVEPESPESPPRTKLVVKPPSMSPESVTRLLDSPSAAKRGIGIEILCLDGTQVKLCVTKETTVRQMKGRIQQLMGRHAALPELWINTEESPQLEDEKTVGSCGIVDGSTIYVLEGADTTELLRDMLLRNKGLQELWRSKEALLDTEAAVERLGELAGVKSDGQGTVSGINLCNIKLEAIPDSFCKFASLIDVNFSACKLSSIPESFCDLTTLQDLILSENRLTCLPKAFGQLVKLEHLDMRGNSLEGLPESFTELILLEFCNLAGNRLSALPEDFGQLVSLQTCYLHGNVLTALPESFGSLAELDELKLGDWFGSNPLIGFPSSMVNLKSLRLLYVQKCPIKMSEEEKRSFEEELDDCEIHWPIPIGGRDPLVRRPIHRSMSM
jgi:hypothetical protein